MRAAIQVAIRQGEGGDNSGAIADDDNAAGRRMGADPRRRGSTGGTLAVTQLGFEGMPRRLYPCTPSRLRAWLDCPRRYRMTYLDRPPPRKGPPWAHNSLGASVHNALAAWWRLARPERTVAAAGDLLEQGWISDGYASATQSEDYLRWTRPQVESYASGLDPQAEPVGVERTVAAKTSVIALSGRIDRLDSRPGEDLVVVDYKTGREPPSAHDARSSLTLALYALAAGRSLRRPCHAVELHHVPTGQVAVWLHTDESLERHLRRAEDIALECAEADERFRSDPQAGSGDEVFPPSPGAWCGWCDFRAHCPEGMAAASQRRSSDGLIAPGAA